MITVRAALLVVMLGICWGAVAQPVTSVRVGDHPGFGRVVFDLPDGAAFDVVVEGERVLIVFRGAGTVGRPAGLPRNVLGVETAGETATLSLAPGAQARSVRLGRRLVVDVFDARAGVRQVGKPGSGQPGGGGKVPVPGSGAPGGAQPMEERAVADEARVAGALVSGEELRRELPAGAGPLPGGGVPVVPSTGKVRVGAGAPVAAASPGGAGVPAAGVAPGAAAARVVGLSANGVATPVEAAVPASGAAPGAAAVRVAGGVDAGAAGPVGAGVPVAGAAPGAAAARVVGAISDGEAGPVGAGVPVAGAASGVAATRVAGAAPDKSGLPAGESLPVGAGGVVAAGAPVVPVAQEVLFAAGSAPARDAEGVGGVVGPGFLIRTDADVGAAAFRRGAFGVVVLDRRLGAPPTLPPGIEWTVGAVTTVMRVPLASGAGLLLTRGPAGWTVVAAPVVVGQVGAASVVVGQVVVGQVGVGQVGAGQVGAASGVVRAVLAEGVGLPLARPGRAVSVVDPLTGAALLVGTSLASGAEAGVAEGRRTPEYSLLPSWLGVAVEPASDRVDLRVGAGGFVLAGGAPGSLGASGKMTRRFDVPDQPAPALLNRLQAHLAGAAGAAPRARARDRMGAAQDMVALGMGAEAQALLQLAAADDPQAAADAELSGLAGVAAVLAGRPKEAEGLDDPRLDGTDEIALWRGLRDRQAGRDTVAARGLGAFAPLVQSYPPTLQRLVWPDVAEAAVEARAAVPAERLPPFAAARLLERDGNVDEAIAAYQSLVDGPDRLAQVKAAVRLAELLLTAGRIGPAEAATALERQSIAWRGDGQEASFLLRGAELRGAGGDWRAALDALRTIRAQFPERREEVQARTAAVLQAMLAVEGKGLSPVQLVLLAAEHADAMPAGPAGAALARLLAEKLAALDLPARAIPVLQGLVRGAPAGPARAEFGGRLAQMLLDGGDAAGASMALEASVAGELPGGLRESRGLLQARVRAATGDVAGAAAGLFELGTAAADDLRATLLADAGQWRGSLSALGDLAAKLVPAEGALSEAAQAVLLRQASAAARAPDAAMLRVLERSASRMTGPRADLFRVLTAPPLGSVQDLPRAARELSLARAVPQQLDALRSR